MAMNEPCQLPVEGQVVGIPIRFASLHSYFDALLVLLVQFTARHRTPVAVDFDHLVRLLLKCVLDRESCVCCCCGSPEIHESIVVGTATPQTAHYSITSCVGHCVLDGARDLQSRFVGDMSARDPDRLIGAYQGVGLLRLELLEPTMQCAKVHG